MDGSHYFAHWLPKAVINLVKDGANLADAPVAAAIGDAMVATVFMVVVYGVITIFSGLQNLYSKRTMFRGGDGVLGFLRRIAGFAVVAIHWYGVLCITFDGVLPLNSVNKATIAGLLWVLLGAIDHSKTWLNLSDEVVIAKRGFAIFRCHTLTLALGEAFKRPSGDPIGNLKRLSDTPVIIAPQAVAALAPYRGGERQAKSYLEAVLTKAGGSLAR